MRLFESFAAESDARRSPSAADTSPLPVRVDSRFVGGNGPRPELISLHTDWDVPALENVLSVRCRIPPRPDVDKSTVGT